jgi:D-glycero-D-manno-heptose 1,7-bisphosphate phosphatase
VTRVEEFRLLPGAIEGMARLAACGYELVIASNQRGIARGLVGEAVLGEVEAAIQRALEPRGVGVSGFYYCPHQTDDPACDCRKPKPGMLLRAASELDLDLSRSWMIGDSPSDVAAGAAAGTLTAYIGSEAEPGATLRAVSLKAAAAEICSRS